MKKFLVVLLACAMIFGFASTAMAADTQIQEFSDIADQSLAARNAIMKLAVLGVIEGNEGLGGAFRPADNLTRAEFAKIVCYLTGNVKIASSLTSVGSKFSDVSTGNWYTGWVNAAAQSGYFQGDPGGTFRPNANITMQEVVAVALRCAGYTDKLPGSWPGNYVSKASNVGLLDDVEFVGSAAATRADMAIICEATLGINMVAHISNEIAYGLGLSTGEVDPDGFSEIYYISNETNKLKTYETILHKAFKGEYFDLVIDPAYVVNGDLRFDETEGWKYEDFASGELSLNVSGATLYVLDKKFEELKNYSATAATWDTYNASEELASTYYITRNFDLTDLSGMQAQLTVLDRKEIAFVDVVSSKQDAASIYKSGTNVMVDGKGLRPSNTVGVGNRIGSVNDLSAGFTFANNTASANKVWTLDDSSSDNTFGGRVYLDKDGRVYAVKNYDAYNGLNNVIIDGDSDLHIGFGIFDKVQSNIVEFKGDTAISTVKTDKDYVLYKDGEQVKFEDLDENDLVYYLGKAVNAKFFVAYAPVEGDLSNQTSTKLTVGGTGYRVDWNYYASGTAVVGGVTVDSATQNYFQFSDDGGESFNALNITLPTDKIDSFGDSLYAKAYNFNRLAYVASNLTNTKVIGVVTKITPTSVWSSGAFKPRYEEVTIYNTEGKEVKYTFTSNFRDGYNALLNKLDGNSSQFVTDDGFNVAKHWNAAIEGIKAGSSDINATGLNKGDIVQLTLDKSDNVKKIANYTHFAPGNPLVVQTQSTKNRITHNSTSYVLHKDAVVFSVSTDGNAYDDVGTLSLASVLASDFYTRQLKAFDVKSSSDVMVLYLVESSSTMRFGVHTGNAKNDPLGMYYTINGNRITNADGASNLPSTPAVIAYTVVSGEAKIDMTGTYRITASSTDAQAQAVVAAVTAGAGGVNPLWSTSAVFGEIIGWNSNNQSLQIGSISYFLNDSSFKYDLDDDSEVTNPAELKGRRAVIYYDRNGEILFVAALNDGAPSSNTSVTTVAGASTTWSSADGKSADTRKVGSINLTHTQVLAINASVAAGFSVADITLPSGASAVVYSTYTAGAAGAPGAFTVAGPVALTALPAASSNTVYFTVTAANGTVAYYQLTINKAASSTSNAVASVSVKGRTATWNATTTRYEVELPLGSVLTDIYASDIVVVAADSLAVVGRPVATNLAGGAWQVTVTSESGVAVNYNILITVTAAVAITDFEAVLLGTDGATLTWTAPVGATGIVVEIAHNNAGVPGAWVALSNVAISGNANGLDGAILTTAVGAGSSSATVTGLGATTRFFFRIVVTGGNNAGDSNSDDITTP